MAQIDNSISDLPVDLLAGVLQHVKQSERLHGCALVSRRWRQAASLATSSVRYTADADLGFDSFSLWLTSNEYVGKIQKINVDRLYGRYIANKQPLRFPFSSLKQLQILQLPACQLKNTLTTDTADSATGSPVAADATAAAASTACAGHELSSLGILTALTRLELDETLLDLSELSSCTALQHLALRNAYHVETDAAAAAGYPKPLCAAEVALHPLPLQLASAVPQLTSLTYLQLCYHHWDPCEGDEQLPHMIVASLSNLQQLQELELGLSYDNANEGLAHLPASLTALHLDDSPWLSLDTVPHLLRLTALQQLYLASNWRVDPAALLSLTQITRLDLAYCHVGKASAAAELLAAVQQLTQLKDLRLIGTLKIECQNPELYAALTASSQLTALDLHDCHIPQLARDIIFSASRAPSKLTYVGINTIPLSSAGSFDRLLAFCPALEALVLGNDGQSSTIDEQGILLLSGISTFTRLSFSQVDLTDDRLQDVSKCMQLRNLGLEIWPTPEGPFTIDGLMHLTLLTGLTCLDLRVELTPDSDQCDVEKRLVADSPPYDVHVQLRRILEAQKLCSEAKA